MSARSPTWVPWASALAACALLGAACLDGARQGGLVGAVGVDVGAADAGSVDSAGLDASPAAAVDVPSDTGFDAVSDAVSDAAADLPAMPDLPTPTWTDYEWIEVVASGAAPAPRYGHFAAYDPRRHRMLVGHGMDPYAAGGGCCKPEYDEYADLWSLDLATWTWTELAAETPIGHLMDADALYDPQADTLWVASDAALYRVNSAGAGWALVSAIPGPAYSYAYLLDASPTTVRLLQTADSNGNGALSIRRLELATGAWETTPVPHPLGVRWHFDVAGGLLSGGYTGETTTGTIWRLGDGAWGELPIAPTLPPRHQHQSVHDPTGGRLILFGGGGGCYSPGPPGCDTTELAVIDLATATALEVTAAGPEHVREATMVYASGSHEAVLFGGAVGSSYAVAATWRLTLP